MTAQSQRLCDFWLIDREMELKPSAPGFFHPSAALIPNGAAPNGAKRVREAVGAPTGTTPLEHSRSGNISNLPPPPPAVNFHEEQSQLPAVVSTGFRLSSASISSILCEELAVQIKREKDEIEQLIYAQGKQIRRTLARKQRRNFRSLIGAANDSIAGRLKEKEAAVKQAAARSAELEDRIARLRTESMAWQAMTMASQEKAASLYAQLQQATSTTPVARREGSLLPAADAESAFVDPDRIKPGRACRVCGWREASVVLLPCRHLCLCEACDGVRHPAESCPVCRCVGTGSIQTFLA
ncbi:BOI-related E3 ubiquitin-protein ligase 1-like [Curcuma longa]|uniref:BOI-related E3 ubiquitin-protein ligase 1-like n=1 Tax=Curcuma longa TaxID=136217 RepID=UPI003D9DC1A1